MNRKQSPLSFVTGVSLMTEPLKSLHYKQFCVQNSKLIYISLVIKNNIYKLFTVLFRKRNSFHQLKHLIKMNNNLFFILKSMT